MPYIHFEGVYGEQVHPFKDTMIHHEPLHIRCEKYDWYINEHLHADLMQIFLIQSGSGYLLSEDKKIELTAPCALIIPSNTLHGFKLQSDIVGEVFTFSETFYEQSLKNETSVKMKLHRLQQFVISFNQDLSSQLATIKESILSEIKGDHLKKNTALELYFSLFLINLYRISVQSTTNIIQSDNRTLTYFYAFQNLIRKSRTEDRSISYFSKKLNITPVHLNRICRTLVQKSALEIVHEFVVSEAKKQLLETSKSITEISYALDFKDPAHFSKFFRKMTGSSPRQFKQEKQIFSTAARL